MKHFIWSSQGSAIWEAACKLQEDANQVDVYLHTSVGAEVVGHGRGTTPRAPYRRKKSYKDSTSFPAHRLILAAASPFLEKVLCEHDRDHHDVCVDITLPHVLPEALHCILNFLYCGMTAVPPGIRESVVEAASLLQIKDFTDHYPSSVKLEELCERENVTIAENPNGYELKTTEALHQRQRKRKRAREEQNAHCGVSTADVQIKMESASEQISDGSGGGGGGGIVGIVTERKQRKVKSTYSTDIYEVSLPKMRKWRRRKFQSFLMTEKETTAPNLTEIIKEPEVFEGPQKHTQSTLDTDQKSNQSQLEKPLNIEKPQQNLTCDLSSTCVYSAPPPTASSSFTEKEDKTPSTQISLALASIPSSTIITNVFVTDQPYLPDSPSLPHTVTEISCGSAIVQEDSMVINKRSLEPPTVTVASQPTPSLLPEVKEPPLISHPLESFPMKQMTYLNHHKISGAPQEDKSEEEQEDGLFKFQVLLKECEDFPDEVCSVPESSQGTRVDSATGKGNIDINHWIPKEIHACVTPTTKDCNKESSQCQIPLQDSKKETVQESLTTEETKPPDTVVDKSKGEVECEKCGKRFSDHRSCQSHIRGVHDEAKQMCRYCGKMFRRRCDLYQHERRHRTASLPCTYCGKIFKVAKDLQAHVATHVGGKRFHCSHCSKELTSYRNLKNHIASIHQKQRPFTCQVCKKTYSKACSLQVHMRSVHTGERPFKCSLCRKTFCDAALLKNHQVVHTGEKKYLCRVCGRPFSQYSNMISHQRIHTNTRPFLCLVCQEDFKTKEGLLKHKWIHTGLKPLRCRHCFREFRIKGRYERHMLKCHNEVINLPDISFEFPDEEVSVEETSTSPCDIELIRTAEEEEPLENGTPDQMLDNSIIDEGSPNDLGPVVHLVSSMAEQEVASEEPAHVQLSYPLLTSTTGLEEGDSITLENIAGQITCSGQVEPLDVESLLNHEEPASGGSLITEGEGKAEVLPATIHESNVRDCEEVVILTKVSEDAEGISQEMHPQPTIKLWIPSQSPELEHQDGEGDGGGDILIVSNGNFTETGQVLDPEMSPQVVHTMILEQWFPTGVPRH